MFPWAPLGPHLACPCTAHHRTAVSHTRLRVSPRSSALCTHALARGSTPVVTCVALRRTTRLHAEHYRPQWALVRGCFPTPDLGVSSHGGRRLGLPHRRNIKGEIGLDDGRLMRESGVICLVTSRLRYAPLLVLSCSMFVYVRNGCSSALKIICMISRVM